MARRYYEIELGRMTTGYDPKQKVTLVRCWSLAATGPDELSEGALDQHALKVVEQILREAAEQATYEAAVAANAVPGEFTAKLSTAWHVFWERFPTLVQTNANDQASRCINSFQIGLFEDVVSVEGLVLELEGGKATAKMYAKVYEMIRAEVDGDVGTALGQYFGLMNQYNDLMTASIRIEAPRELTDAIARTVEIAEAMEDIPQRLVDLADAAQGQLREGVSSLVLQAGNVNKRVAEQLSRAGIPIDFTAAPLTQLLDGEPRLDLRATSEQLQRELQRATEEVFNNVGANITTRAQEALSRLEDIKRQLNDAIQKGARESVEALQGRFKEVSKDFESAQAQLTNLATQLKTTPVAAVAGALEAQSTALTASFAGLSTFTAGATAAVEARIQVIAREVAQEALRAAQRAVDEARNAVNRVFGW